MPSEYAKTLGARLRAIRTQQGLSLHGVEEKSRGRWKAVVVGSYERGDRSVTVQKLAEGQETGRRLGAGRASEAAQKESMAPRASASRMPQLMSSSVRSAGDLS